MPTDAPDPLYVPRKPAWLEETTLKAMEQALYRATAFGRDGHRITQAVRDVALSHMPAAPMWMIAEAVQCIVPDPQGLAASGVMASNSKLTPATVDELVSSIGYGLRFDERGKPRRTGVEFAATLAAAQIVKQLQLSGYVLHKRPPEKQRGPGLAF